MTTEKKTLTLQNIERTIRYTFRKTDSSNLLLRQRIYETIWHAHERLLLSQTQLKNSEKEKKRLHLIHLLKAIESEYCIAHKKSNNQPDIVRGEEEKSADSVTKKDNLGTHSAQQAQYLSKSSKHLRYTLSVIFMIGILTVILFFYNSGTDSDRLSHSHTDNLISANDKNSWIQIFDPLNITALATRGDAITEIHNNEVSFIRVQTKTIDDCVILEIGPDALMQLRGKKTTMGIIARGVGRNDIQLSMTYDFGSDQNTRQQWFQVPPTITPLLFPVAIPQSTILAAKLYIRIRSSLLNKKNEIDIFSVIVQTED